MPKEYIERQATINAVTQDMGPRRTHDFNAGCARAVNRIIEIPAANVVARDCYDRLLAENDRLREERPVTHGYWKRERNGILYCSVCDAVSPAEDLYEESIVCPKYCHVCGSVMDMKGGESDA